MSADRLEQARDAAREVIAIVTPALPEGWTAESHVIATGEWLELRVVEPGDPKTRRSFCRAAPLDELLDDGATERRRRLAGSVLLQAGFERSAFAIWRGEDPPK